MKSSGSSLKRVGPARALAAALVLASGPALLGPAAAFGAVERDEVRVEIAADGSFVEHRKLTVRLDDPAALDRWRMHAVALDDHRQLLSAEAWRITPEGKRRKLPRRARDEAEYSGEGITYSSQRFLIFEPDVLEVGAKLVFDVRVEVKPYFPAGVLALQPSGDSVEALDIVVTSAAGPLRFDLSGVGDPGSGGPSVEVSDGRETVTVRGALDAPDEPPVLAAEDPRILRFAWGPPRDWPDIARWYAEIEGAVRHGGPGLDALAEEVLAAGAGARERLEKAVDLARRRIRYVAVEVGIGGYRPSPAAETASRGWGDCKDKSLLLIELLRRAGFSASPALVRLDRRRRISLDVPTPYDFNHLIAAVRLDDGGPAATLALGDRAPVADGWLFIDPTQTTGSAVFLHRGVQDQQALVVTGGDAGGQLVRLPTLPHSEEVVLGADVRPGDGAVDIDVDLRLFGESAATLSRSLDAMNPGDLEGALRGFLLGYFPGAAVDRLSWEGSRDGLPTFEVAAALRLPGAELGQLRLPSPDLFPSLPDLDAVAGLTAALGPGAVRFRTRLHLPEGVCPPRDRERRTENASGSFAQRISTAEGVVSIDYDAVLARAWHPPGTVEALRELAVAEHRASRRRLRFRCDE